MGVGPLQHLLQDNSLKPFSQLQSEYTIPTSEYFTYLRIQHCLKTVPLPLYNIHPKTWDYLTNPNTNLRGISYFYNSLHQKHTFTKLKPHKKWEIDLNHEFTDNQWHQAFKSTYKATKCAALWELAQKISLRWYMTPARITSINPQVPNICWRCNSSPGDLLHIFWSCHLLKTYWDSIFQLISNITHIKTPPSPALAILNLTIEDLPHPFRIVTTHILMAAKLNIARHWKSDTSLTLTQVVDLVSLHYSYEHTSASDTNHYKKIQSSWQPWTTWTRGCAIHV